MPSSITSSTIVPKNAQASLSSAPSLPPHWTAEHVGSRLIEAFRTLDRLPRVKGPRTAGNHWPLHRREFADCVAEADLPETERRTREHQRNDLAFRPSGTDIARMDDALDWLRGLREEDADLALLVTLWAFRTARGRTIRVLCREQGWAPPTFYKRRDRALGIIAARREAAGEPVR